ncbi:DUF2336 domain-containing protein [Rickettsiales bacterium]|nr:DUF2336 domain-containing protein [Rickettsiales bacterium]
MDNTNADGFRLTAEDVKELIRNPSVEAKNAITEKLSRQYAGGDFSESQKEIADQIFRLLVKDIEVKIRETISANLKDVSNVPKDIILSLAKDVEKVSLPVLVFSDVLDDNDLIEIIESTSETSKHVAISKRKDVSDSVSGALIDTESQIVVDSLLDNKTANLSDDVYEKIVDNFTDNEEVLNNMMSRGNIPLRVIEKIATTVSDAIYQELAYKHDDIFDGTDKIAAKEGVNLSYSGLSHDGANKMNTVEEVVTQSRELATMKMMGLNSSDFEVQGLINDLKLSGKISPVLSLCLGDMPMFESNMARLSSINVANVRRLIWDESGQGLIALYKKAEMPVHIFEEIKYILNILCQVIKENQKKNEIVHLNNMPQLMLDKMNVEPDNGAGLENLDCLKNLIERNASMQKVRSQIWDDKHKKK